MKRILFILLSVLSLTAFAKDADKTPLPQWFMKPAAHTYVGISAPNGDVQEAINVALLHYLICHDFTGKIKRENMDVYSSEERTSTLQTILKLDTMVQYSIEDITSTSNGEYICRISDKPTLSRRIILTYYTKSHTEEIGENVKYESEASFKCYYDDKTGKSSMIYMVKMVVDENSNEEYAYLSQYTHKNGVTKEYANDKTQTSLGEQLIVQYTTRLEEEFFIEENNESDANSGGMTKAYHKSMPFKGFEYIDGHLAIAF